MPHDLYLKGANTVHRTLMKLSGGRFGWELIKMPVVELTTIGRTSGLPRTVLLTAPYTEGDRYVVVASRGGDDHHPAWYLNLVANPQVEVTTKAHGKRAMTARVATPEERAELWPVITGKYKNYAGYQSKTTREIPLVLLDPVS